MRRRLIGPFSGEHRVGERAEQKRRWDNEHQRLTCPDCGAPTWKGKRCKTCQAAVTYAEQRTRHAALCDEIERLWNDGATTKAISTALEVPQGSIHSYMNRMRREGRDLPYRHRYPTTRKDP